MSILAGAIDVKVAVVDGGRAEWGRIAEVLAPERAPQIVARPGLLHLVARVVTAVASSIYPEGLPELVVGPGEIHHKDLQRIRFGTLRLRLLCLCVRGRGFEEMERFGGTMLVVDMTVGIAVGSAVVEEIVAAEGTGDVAVPMCQ